MVMHIYQNLSRQSGVRAYEVDATSIKVKFADGRVYEYTHEVTGRAEGFEEQDALLELVAADGAGACPAIVLVPNTNVAMTAAPTAA